MKMQLAVHMVTIEELVPREHYAHVTTAAQKEAARTMEKVLTAAL